MPIFRPSTLVNLTIIFDEEFSKARESNPDLTLGQFVTAQDQVGTQLGSNVQGVNAYLVTPISVVARSTSILMPVNRPYSSQMATRHMPQK